MATLGDRMREARELMGITREKLAELLEISTQHLANIEHGKRKMSIETLMRASKIFSITTDYLLFGTTEQQGVPLAINDMLTNLNEEERALSEQMLKLTIRALRAGK